MAVEEEEEDTGKSGPQQKLKNLAAAARPEKVNRTGSHSHNDDNNDKEPRSGKAKTAILIFLFLDAPHYTEEK
jgi:hypothetical protein